MVNDNFSDWWIEFSKGVKRSVPPRMIRLKDIENERAKTDNAELYTTYFRYPTDDPYIGPVYGGFLLDFDDETNPNRARKEAYVAVRYLRDVLKIPEEFIDIRFSGQKGISIVVPAKVFGVEPSVLLPVIFKRMAKNLARTNNLKKIDTKIYERRRLWRPPNSKHGATGLYKIFLTAKELADLKIEEIKRIATAPRHLARAVNPVEIPEARAFYLNARNAVEEEFKERKEFTPTQFKFSQIPPCVEARFAKGSPQGSRNQHAFEISVYFARRGEPIEKARNAILEFAQRCTPPLEKGEATRALESAYRGVEEGKYSIGCSSDSIADLCPGKERCFLFAEKAEKEPTFLEKIARQLGTSIAGETPTPTPVESGPFKTTPHPLNLSLILIRKQLIEIHGIMNEVAVRHNVGDLVEIATATYVSLALGERDPIWIWLVGPPSSFKTELVKSTKDAKVAYFLRTMTANAFASGAEGSIDLLPRLDGRCFVCPDWATLLSGSDETSKKILGDLVSIYDGDYSKHSPARGDIRYKTRMTMLGCVTPSALEKYEEYMSIIGPRLLFYKLPELGEEEAKKGLEKTWIDNEEKFTRFREKTSEFCDLVLRYAIETKVQPEIPDDLRPEIDRLALFVSHGRGVIYGQWVTFMEEGGKSVTYYEITGVQREDPYRIHLQFQKLAKALAIVHGRNKVTGHEIELLRRIAISSMPSARADVLSAFRQQSTIDGSITSRELAGAVGKSVKTSRRRLQELEMLGIVRSETEENLGGMGKPPIRYRPIEKFQDIITTPVGAVDHIADLRGAEQVCKTNETRIPEQEKKKKVEGAEPRKEPEIEDTACSRCGARGRGLHWARAGEPLCDRCAEGYPGDL